MENSKRLVVKLSDEVLKQIENNSLGITNEMAKILDNSSATFERLDSGSKDSRISNFFIINTDNQKTAEKLLDDLLKSGNISSGYIKPDDEPPS